MAQYETLTNADLLATARDALRGAETDHYRTTNSPRAQSNAAYLETLDAEVEHWRSEIKRLEPLVEDEQARALADVPEAEAPDGDPPTRIPAEAEPE